MTLWLHETKDDFLPTVVNIYFVDSNRIFVDCDGRQVILLDRNVLSALATLGTCWFPRLVPSLRAFRCRRCIATGMFLHGLH